MEKLFHDNSCMAGVMDSLTGTLARTLTHTLTESMTHRSGQMAAVFSQPCQLEDLPEAAGRNRQNTGRPARTETDTAHQPGHLTLGTGWRHGKSFYGTS